MTRTLIIFIISLFSQSTLANIAISRLIEESDLVVHGEVIETKPSSVSPDYDMTATIKIVEVLYGKWNDSIIEVPFCEPGLNACETYYLKEELIAFLKITPSIKTTFGNHGKFTLESKLQDSLASFIQAYLLATDETDKTKLIIDFISIDPDYSFLSSDLLLIDQRLSLEEQTRVLKIVLSSDSVLSISRFIQSESINERQPYRIIDYYDMLLVISDSELKKKAVEYLVFQLENESSNYLARTIISRICQLQRKSKACKKILKEYDEENKWSDGTDSLNEKSDELIQKLTEEIKKQAQHR